MGSGPRLSGSGHNSLLPLLSDKLRPLLSYLLFPVLSDALFPVLSEGPSSLPTPGCSPVPLQEGAPDQNANTVKHKRRYVCESACVRVRLRVRVCAYVNVFTLNGEE